jgi:preprotein translocase subunit Sss1
MKKTKGYTMKKIIEYMSVIMATVGTLAMVGAVGSIEIDKYLQGASMALLGIVSYILALYAQELYKDYEMEDK